jgi:hypothetical protein
MKLSEPLRHCGCATTGRDDPCHGNSILTLIKYKDGMKIEL